jgi:hypothetical protein
MKLELKHLAAYLPYGLKFKTDFDHIRYQMTGLDIIRSVVTLKAINNAKNSKKIAIKKLGSNKPILRPLSDLTKEIEVNGERFVPKDILFRGDKSWVHFKRAMIKNAIHCEPYYIVEQLLEWHFDVFNLIPNGLAEELKS